MSCIVMLYCVCNLGVYALLFQNKNMWFKMFVLCVSLVFVYVCVVICVWSCVFHLVVSCCMLWFVLYVSVLFLFAVWCCLWCVFCSVLLRLCLLYCVLCCTVLRVMPRGLFCGFLLYVVICLICVCIVFWLRCDVVCGVSFVVCC